MTIFHYAIKLTKALFGLILISDFRGLQRNVILLLVKVRNILQRRLQILSWFRSKNPIKSTCLVFKSFRHYRLNSFLSSFHRSSKSCHALFFKGLISLFHFGVNIWGGISDLWFNSAHFALLASLGFLTYEASEGENKVSILNLLFAILSISTFFYMMLFWIRIWV